MMPPQPLLLAPPVRSRRPARGAGAPTKHADRCGPARSVPGPGTPAERRIWWVHTQFVARPCREGLPMAAGRAGRCVGGGGGGGGAPPPPAPPPPRRPLAGQRRCCGLPLWLPPMFASCNAPALALLQPTRVSPVPLPCPPPAAVPGLAAHVLGHGMPAPSEACTQPQSLLVNVPGACAAAAASPDGRALSDTFGGGPLLWKELSFAACRADWGQSGCCGTGESCCCCLSLCCLGCVVFCSHAATHASLVPSRLLHPCLQTLATACSPCQRHRQHTNTMKRRSHPCMPVWC